jgi:DNA-binding transcriptional LysR family regulator
MSQIPALIHRPQRKKLLALITIEDNSWMELRQLEVFVAVAEENSFTHASDRLHVVQSAVSAAVRALEKDLSTALFERTTRSVALTDAGAVLLPEARAVLAAATLARDSVEQTKGGLRGTVALGIMQAGTHPGLSVAEMIAAFQRNHPRVELSVRHVGGSGVLAEALRSGDVDVGVLSLPEAVPDLKLTELYSETMVLACTADHRLAGLARVSLSDIAEETFVDGPPSWGTRLATDRAFARTGAERTVRFEINDTGTIVEFVRAGAALALLPASLTVGRPEIVTIELEGEPILFRTLLAVPALRRQTAAAQTLATAIITAVRRI